nr:MAG TPA: hypothetical protein [Caudoviricetes sp.]
MNPDLYGVTNMTTERIKEKIAHYRSFLSQYDKKDFRGYREFLAMLVRELNKREPVAPVKKKRK